MDNGNCRQRIQEWLNTREEWDGLHGPGPALRLAHLPHRL